MSNPWVKPLITDPKIPKKPKYDTSTMTLAELLNVLLDHCMTFEQLRDMTFEQIDEQFAKIEAGELKTWAQVKAEEAKARDKGKK